MPDPTGQDYWLLPGQTVTIMSHKMTVHHESGVLTVRATAWFATVSDDNGDEVPGGCNRPADPD